MQSLQLNRIPASVISSITALAEGLDRLDPHWIEGIYLTGSIPLNDFYPHKSDIDFLIIGKEFPTQERIIQIAQLHTRIQNQFKKPPLSGTYLTLKDLKAESLSTSRVLHFHEGQLQQGTFGMAPITLYELKTIAHTVVGTPAAHLPINLDLKEVQDFLFDNIHSYWLRWIKAHASFTRRKGLLVLVPRLTEWAVLGVARQLCTLQTGKIVSKTEAGYYGLQHVPAFYHPILQQAIAIRKEDPNRIYPVFRGSYYIKPSWERAAQTIACVQYLIARFKQVYDEKRHLR